MGKEAAFLVLLGVLIFLQNSFVSVVLSLNKSSTIDESSLLSLKAHLINSDMLEKNWTKQTSYCTWIGVLCSRRHDHQRVTGLNLSSMGLQGSIARDIGNLTFLTFLDASKNSIHGWIPGEVGNLRRLRVLDMSFNHLTGHIPHTLALLRNLKDLILWNNFLSGHIPTTLSACLQLTTLDLDNNNLTGNIPTGFGNLSRLQYLSLSSNQLTGEIPSAIFNISSLVSMELADNQMFGYIPEHICRQAAKLENLLLYQNHFEGEIPSTLMHCSSLKQLSLALNKFKGNIPTQLWNLSSIQVLELFQNQLQGIIPSSVTNLSKLESFVIGENNFHGTIPSEMGQLSSLTWLNLESNKLNGQVPPSIFNLSRLQMLALGFNNLTGSTLPFSIDQGIPDIEEIYLPENHFHGKIPTSISNLSRLVTFELPYNSFMGHIPLTLGNLHQLQWLGLAGNQFTDDVSKPEQDFLSSLATCKYLTYISIGHNPITGALPKSLGSSNLSSSLVSLDASSSRIIGPIPDEIGNLSKLVELSLGDNALSGAIPMALGSLRSLQKLEIHGNKLQGSISHALCNLHNLFHLDLATNSLVGQLPACLGNLSMLREINLADNAFSSIIPSTIWLSEHFERIDFSNNFFHGVLSPEISTMKSVRELDLSGNQFSGAIPGTISLLRMLIHLSLSNNKLDGPISDAFYTLKDLQYLDLSQNYLSGVIPKSLEALQYLNYFNVSFNKLSGEIPDKGPFVNFSASSFTGNKGLCGSPRFKVEACKKGTSTLLKRNKLLIYILPAIALLVAVVLILMVVLRYCGRKLLPSSVSDSAPGLMHERISYYEILHATSNLDEQCLIGRGSFGSVYKGNFSEATIYAIKVFNLDVQGGLKSFDTECHMLRNIRHRNLVKVITACSNLDFKALVMEYMPNGNLDEWLSSANCSSNISNRLGIMIDVAAALEYLHQGYIFPIVHCDLKPNNILLDEDMVAHVADFGIAKILTQEQRMQQTTTLGTIGYMAPEYGSEGLVSTPVDVYSFGILMMEILSRRKPTNEMFTGELSMKKWVSRSFPHAVMEIVDVELVNMNDGRGRARQENCFIAVIELALQCTADLPEERPNMKDVTVRLNKIRLNL